MTAWKKILVRIRDYFKPISSPDMITKYARELESFSELHIVLNIGEELVIRKSVNAEDVYYIMEKGDTMHIIQCNGEYWPYDVMQEMLKIIEVHGIRVDVAWGEVYD